MASRGNWDRRENGEADILPHEACAEWVAAAPQARAVVLPGVGHFPSFEDPDAFFPVVEAFLEGQDLV